MESNQMFKRVWHIKDEWARVAGLEHSRVLVLCMSATAFGPDWAQLRLPRSQLSTLNHQPSCAPLNKERRFIPLRLDDALGGATWTISE